MIDEFVPRCWPLTSESMAYWGAFGDYVGGIWGTFISLVTLIFVYFTWVSSRKYENFNRVVGLLEKCLDAHSQISLSDKDRPAKFLREFSAIYKIIKRGSIGGGRWSVYDKVDIAYTIAFYGLNTESFYALSRYGAVDVKLVHDQASLYREKLKRKMVLFSGNQSYYSHYMRNLYSAYIFIDQSKISAKQKYELSRLIRSRLSNYDQAVLLLNVISRLGIDWRTDGIVGKYQPFKNIPKLFFSFDEDFDMTNAFPDVIFEWQKSEKRYYSKIFRKFGCTLSISYSKFI